jgi:hypothetical protein
MEMGSQRHALAALSTGKTRYSLYRSLSGTQDRSGRVREISSPSEFDPRTVQPVASRYNTKSDVQIHESMNTFIFLNSAACFDLIGYKLTKKKKKSEVGDFKQ